jgi:hypothetical protein
VASEEETISLAMPELAAQEIPPSRRIFVKDAHLGQEDYWDSGAEEAIPQVNVFGSHQFRIEAPNGSEHGDAREKPHAV